MEDIYILAFKKSKANDSKIYCIAVFRLGTSNAEFIMGEIDSNEDCYVGAATSYINNADYTSKLQNALDWLNKQK